MSELKIQKFQIGDELSGSLDDSIFPVDTASILNIPAWRAGSGGLTSWIIKWGENNTESKDTLVGLLLKVFYYWVRYPAGSDLGVPPEFISLSGTDGNPRTKQRARLVMLADNANLPFVVDLAPTSLFALSNYKSRIDQQSGISLANVISELKLTSRNMDTPEGKKPVASLSIAPVGVVSDEIVSDVKPVRDLVKNYSNAFLKDFERTLALDAPAKGAVSSESDAGTNESDDPFANQDTKASGVKSGR